MESLVGELRKVLLVIYNNPLFQNSRFSETVDANTVIKVLFHTMCYFTQFYLYKSVFSYFSSSFLFWAYDGRKESKKFWVVGQLNSSPGKTAGQISSIKFQMVLHCYWKMCANNIFGSALCIGWHVKEVKPYKKFHVSPNTGFSKSNGLTSHKTITIVCFLEESFSISRSSFFLKLIGRKC